MIIFQTNKTLPSILLVEDNLEWQMRLTNQLKSFGLEAVKTCSSLAEAKSYLNSYIPDLVIADIIWDNDNIFSLFNNESLTRLPFLFITSSENRELFEKAAMCNHWNYLVKPFHELTLLAAINTLLKNYEREIPERPQGIKLRGWKGEPVFVKPSEIIYVEAQGNYCMIKTGHQQYMLKISLMKLLDQLGNQFVQIQRSFFVRKDAIQSINLNKQKVKLSSGDELRFGRKYKTAIIHFTSLSSG